MAEALLRHRKAEDEVIKVARALAFEHPTLRAAFEELDRAEKALTPVRR